MERLRFNISSAWIIHCFALLHAGLTVACRAGGTDDTMLLTMMTMLMTVLLCLRHGLNTELTAASVILVNVFGYLSGIGLASVMQWFFKSPILIHSISTFMTTEILGWFVWWLANLKASQTPREKSSDWMNKMKWLIMACIVILLFRFLFVELLSKYNPSANGLSVFSSFIFSAPTIFILICVNIIYIRLAQRKLKEKGTSTKVAVAAAFVVAASCFTAVLSGIITHLDGSGSFSRNEFLFLFIPAAVLEVTIYIITYLFNYAFSVREEMLEQREKAQMAEYQYFKLKQQVNPHFLFNSLNILDGIVNGGNPGQASDYIHKLASFYRYMLSNEGDSTVLLSEELELVSHYVDLLKIRFQEGLDVLVDVRKEDLHRKVVPCAVQLLVENAVKHNRVQELTVKITSDGENLTVSNNICLKMTPASSTGVGHKYIKSEYMRWSGKPVTAINNGEEYIFKLPLL